jgi:hypothetical protein
MSAAVSHALAKLTADFECFLLARAQCLFGVPDQYLEYDKQDRRGTCAVSETVQITLSSLLETK